MLPLDWDRLLLGTLAAGAIAFLTDGFLHEKLLKADWLALARALGLAVPEGAKKHAPTEMLYFALFDLGRGFAAMIVYALAESQFGAGWTTAGAAGVASWIVCCVTTPAEFIPLRFFSRALWAKAAAFQLVTSILAALAGAAIYR